MGADRNKLVAQLVASIKAFQDAVDRFDAAAAARIGVNETDLRCLTFLSDRPPQRPSELADLLGLTRGATTTALGRLEIAGLIERSNNSHDGRSYFVQLTKSARAQLRALWMPIRDHGAEHLSSYSHAQIRLLIAFMDRSVVLHEDETSALLQDAAAAHAHE